MKTVIIGFSRPKKWKPYAQAIMAIDQSNFDHCYLRFSSPTWDCDFIYQSSGHCTNFSSGRYFLSINVAVEEYSLDVTDEVYAAIGKMAVDREGIPYGIPEVIGKALACFVKWATFQKINIQNPFKSPDPDCITEVSNILAGAAGIKTPLNMATTLPKEFRNWVREIPKIWRIK